MICVLSFPVEAAPELRDRKSDTDLVQTFKHEPSKPVASKPTQYAETAAPAPPAATGAATDTDCLAVVQSSSATYVIENKSCPEKSILTSIELADEGQLARCFTKKIRSQISLASAGAVPLINFQCIEGTPGCSVEVLRTMFPECHGG